MILQEADSTRAEDQNLETVDLGFLSALTWENHLIPASPCFSPGEWENNRHCIKHTAHWVAHRKPLVAVSYYYLLLQYLLQPWEWEGVDAINPFIPLGSTDFRNVKWLDLRSQSQQMAVRTPGGLWAQWSFPSLLSLILLPLADEDPSGHTQNSQDSTHLKVLNPLTSVLSLLLCHMVVIFQGVDMRIWTSLGTTIHYHSAYSRASLVYVIRANKTPH